MVASAGVVAIALTGGFVLAAGDGGQDGSGHVVDQSGRPVVGVADHVLMRGEAGGVSWTLAREEPKGGTGVCLRVRVRRGSGGMCMEDDPFDQSAQREFLPSFTSSLSGEDGPHLLVAVGPPSTDEAVLVRGDSVGEIVSSRQEGEVIGGRDGERIDADRSWRPRRGRVADEPLPLFVEVLSAQQASELGAVRAG